MNDEQRIRSYAYTAGILIGVFFGFLIGMTIGTGLTETNMLERMCSVPGISLSDYNRCIIENRN